MCVQCALYKKDTLMNTSKIIIEIKQNFID